MDVDGRDDATLVGAARAGDRSALARLLERHRPMARSLCRRMLGDASAADDAFQEAALQAMLALDRLRQPSRFGPWLSGIALNVCRGMLEARPPEQSWEALVGGGRLDEPADPAPDPTLAVELGDLSARVRRAVDDLPPGQRAAVLLVYLAGLSQAETAALLGTPVGAIKTRLHKARARLRRDLLTLWMEETMATKTASRWVEVRVMGVRRRASGPGGLAAYCVVLEEVDGPRLLPIWIGQVEARAMVAKLEGIAAPRPQSDLLTKRLLEAVGGRLVEARVIRLTDDVFYAAAVVDGPAGRVEVDARPSDAVNLALLFGAPIRADAAMMARAGVVPDDSGAGALVRGDQQEIAAEIRRDLEHTERVREETQRDRAAGYPEWRPEEHAGRLDAGAQAVLAAAEAEARRYNHDWVGTEHVLLGLIRTEGEVARLLGEAGVTLDAARAAVEARIGSGERPPTLGRPRQTPRLRLALGRALAAAEDGPVGAEHLLLAVGEYEGLATAALRDLGVDLAALRGKIAPTG